MPINGTTGSNIPVTNVTNDPPMGSSSENNKNTDLSFNNLLSDSIRDQALQSMMERMKNPSGFMNGAGGTNSAFGGISGAGTMPGGLGSLGGTNAMLGGIGGLGGTNAMLGMPSISSGMENTLISTAESGEMSGAQLMLFLMIMMMGNSEGGGDMSFIMQMMASMLSGFSDDVAANRPNPMAMLGDMQGDAPSNVKRMVDAALEKIGYQERNRDGSTGNGNFTKFGAWYGMDGQPWCAMFVSWAADQAGLLHDVVPKHASCARGVAAYQEKGMYATRGSGYTPREGDAIYFTNSSGRISHVGIVVAFDPATNRIYTVEGNTNNAVRIRHYDATNPRIHGFGQNGGTSFGRVPTSSSSGIGANTR